MTGAFLIGFFILAIIFFIIMKIDDYNEESWGIAAIFSAVIGIILIIAIPCSRIGTESSVEYARVLQKTIDFNRESEKEFNVLERTSIIEEINCSNAVIAKWHVKGENWYNNPSTKGTKYIK